MSCRRDTAEALTLYAGGEDKVRVKSKAGVEARAIVGLMPDGTPDNHRCFPLVTFVE
jgi:hypothetical protein